MDILWRIFTNCNSEAATVKIVTAHFGSAGIETPDITTAPYHKGGFVATATTGHSAVSWPCFVVDALSHAQKAATGWMLTGDINEELDAWSNTPRTSGITAIHIQARRRVREFAQSNPAS